MRAETLSLALAGILLVSCSDTEPDTGDAVNENQAPNAVAGADQAVNEGVTVTLDGSASSSPQGKSLSYAWAQVGGSAFSLTGASSATASFTPTVSADSTLTFELTVTDSSDVNASDTVIISVNAAPSATISATQQSGSEGTVVSLSGELSGDSGDGSIASYEWSQLSGTSATINSASEVNASITLPLIDADENLSFQLLVTDNDSASATTSFIITVLDDTEAPVIDSISAADGAYGIGENLTVTIAAANAETGLALHSGSSFNGQALSNFAAVADQDGNYTATYTVVSGDSDRAAGSTVDANITLVDIAGNLSVATTTVTLGLSTSIDANAPTAKAGNSYTVNEAAEVELNASNSFDAYEGSIASYSWQQIEIDEHQVSLDSPESSETNFTAPAELAADITLTFQLTVADSAGNSDTDAVEVRVNNAPTANAGDDQQVNEGASVTLYGSGSSDTGDTIESYSWVQVADIDGNSLSSGALELSDSDTNTATFTAPPVDQDTTLYFRLTVTDGDDASHSDIVTIFINNNPTVTLGDITPAGEVNEGATVTLSGSAEDTDDGTIASYAWVEVDNSGKPVETATVTLSHDDTTQATATFTAPSVDQDTTLYFQLTATDNAGGTDSATATVSVNNSPTITLAETKEVNESTEGVRITTTSTDVGGSISSYRWIEVDSSGSEVNPSSVSDLSGTNTNEITFSTSEVNQDTTLTFQLTVTDNDQASTTDSIVVTINNAPTAEAGSDQEVNESSDNAPIQVTLSGSASSDTNDGEITYLWEFDSSSDSEITSIDLTNANTATATFTTPEVEVNESNQGVTTLTFQLTVTDNDGATHSDLVEVAIHNLPIIDSVYLTNGAYGIDDTATIYIQAGNSETGLTLKQEDNTNHGSFNGGLLENFSEIGDGLYSATYKVLESHASVANGANVETNITLIDAYEHESTTTTAVRLDGEYIDTVRPAIEKIIIADGAYGAGAEMTLHIQVANNEAGLVVKEDSNFSFNDVNLTTKDDDGNDIPIFTEIDSGTYQTIYTVLEGHTQRADGDQVPIAITLTDPAGNDSTTYTPTDSFDSNITLQGESIDTTPPTISITSVGGDDNVTNSSEIDAAEIIGTTTEVEDGQTVTITVKDSIDATISVETTVTANSFSATINLSSLADGILTVTADVSDAAGNAADQAKVEARLDTKAPIIGALVVADGGDGVINSDEASDVQISGTTSDVEDGQTVNLTITNNNDATITTTTTATVSSDGFSTADSGNDLDLSALADGTYNVTASVSDIAGNEATATVDNITKDTDAPTISISSVGGDDDIINSSEADAVVIIGTTSGAEDGQLVKLTITNDDDAQITTTTTVTVSSDGFSTADSGNDLDLSSLADGTYTVTASVSDIAGNEDTATVSNITKDTKAPTISISSVGGDDDIINSAEVNAVAIIGTTSGAEDGQTVKLIITNNGNASITTTTTVTVSSDGFSTADSGNDLDLSALADGTYTVTASVSDIAGNEATATVDNITKDTDAPTISISSVGGDDDIINSSEADAVVIIGTTPGAENGQTVNLTITNNNDASITTTTTATVSSDGFSTADSDLDLSSLADGTYTVTASVSDIAGNEDTATVSNITKDTKAPTISISSVGGDDDIINSAEVNAVAIIGTTSGAEDGQTVKLIITNNGNASITTTATATVSDNAFSTANSDLDLSNLTDGTYTVTASVSDIAGNEATATVDNITKDTDAPTISISSVGGDDDIINSAEDEAVAIIGTTSGAEDGQTVNLTITNNDDATITTTTTATVSGNSFSTADSSLDLSSFADGTYTVTADVSDAAGNAAPQANVSVIIDTTAPVINTSGTSTTVDEAVNATLDASNSTDTSGTGIASYSWVQVDSSSIDTAESVSSADANYVSLSNASNNIANFPAPGIANDSDELTLHFKLTVTDTAGNSASSIVAITIDNAYTTPVVSVNPGVAPNFDQLTLSWPTTSNLTYSLYRSTDPTCGAKNYNVCANGALYTGSTNPSISTDTTVGTASITDTNISTTANLELYTTHYYWLGAELDGIEVLLSSNPIEANTSGPGLNDTGVVECDTSYHDGSNDVQLNKVDCKVGRDADDDTNSSDDGHAGFSFTRLNSSDGSSYTGDGYYDNSPWFCLRDNITGLIWEVKALTDTDDIRDTGTKYTWYNGTGIDGFNGTAGDDTNFNTEELITKVNSLALCGQTNWRLPTASELLSITNYSAAVNDSTAAVDSDYFANMQGEGAYYWTSTLNSYANADGDNNNSSYPIWMYSNGKLESNSTTGPSNIAQHAILVSSTATSEDDYLNDWSDDRYQTNEDDNGDEDGTVTDTRTGLMWMRCVYDSTNSSWGGSNCTDPSGGTATFYDAFGEADTANSGTNNLGHTDWRLPNIQELYSLLDHAAGDNSTTARINATAFPNARASSFWSSTPDASGSSAYYVDFSPTATTAVGTSTISTEHSILLVRDITTSEQ